MPQLSSTHCERLFPFYVAFDRELRILAVGRALRRLLPKEGAAAHLLELFSIERPALPQPSYKTLIARTKLLFILALRDHKLRLRGEILETEEGGFFIGTPWLTDPSVLSPLGLTLKDLALHDQTGELLVALKSMETAMKDANKLAEALKQEAQQREQVVRDLEDKVALIERQRQAIAELSIPIIQIWQGVLAVPIIGNIDNERAVRLMDLLLESIIRHKARYAILDVTGVSGLDKSTAENFVRVLRAVELIGASGIISGIGPAVAQTLVGLDVELGSIRTYASLREALALFIPRLFAAQKSAR